MLKGKMAVVTGSTSGIGLGIAKLLASQQCDIVINGFGDLQEVESICQSIRNDYGVQVYYNDADLSSGDGATYLIEDTVKRFGSVDILVNNAGIQHVAPIEDFTGERWEKVIAINLSAAFYTMASAVPIMQEKGWGRIINIASAHGKVASKGKAAYVASKHGVVGLTKVVALENATKGITCNAVCPGWVLTPLVQKQVDDWAKREDISVLEAERALLGEKQPSLQFTTPDDIGAMVTYLCSDAARNITGTELSIDGGWTAQ